MKGNRGAEEAKATRLPHTVLQTGSKYGHELASLLISNTWNRMLKFSAQTPG